MLSPRAGVVNPRYPPMTVGYILLPSAIRPEVKTYIQRSEVDPLSIYTDQGVVLLYNFDIIHHLFFFSEIHFFPCKTYKKQELNQIINNRFSGT